MLYSLLFPIFIISIPFLLLQVGTSVASVVVYNNILSIIHKISAIFSSFLLLLSFYGLLHAFIHNAVIFDMVNSHTTPNLPLIYKIGAIWSNSAGSIFLELAIISLFSLFFNLQTIINSHIIAIANGILGLFQLSLMIYLLFPHNNPFVLLHHRLFLGELNPMLKNIWLVVHPPSLYAGYSLSILLTAVYMGAMIHNKLRDFKTVLLLKFVAVIAFSLLSLGLVIGSIWAYYTLGWGGLWFWDSVENLALLPWLGLLGVIHALLFIPHQQNPTKYSSESAESNRNLALLWLVISTTLILAGIILERSNLLISSHSFFEKKQMGIYFLILAFVILLSLLWMLAIAITTKISFKNKIFFLINSVLLGSILIILLGIVYPIISNFYGHAISIGATFYNIILVPLWIITYLALTFHLKHKKTALSFFSIGILLSLYSRIYYPLSVKDTIISLAICSTALSVSASLLFTLYQNFSTKKLALKHISTTLIHISIATLMIGWLSVSVYSKEKIIDLRINIPTTINKKIYLLKDVKTIANTNAITGVQKKQIYTIINVSNPHTNRLEHTLRPSLLKENKGTGWQITNTNPDTILTPLSNTYIALVNDVASRNNKAHEDVYYSFRVYQHYLFSLILFAYFLFFMGLILYAVHLVTEISHIHKSKDNENDI